MKKLFTLLSLMALICLSANVWAQDDTHYPGEQHKYSVTDHSSSGASYAWEVYTDATLGTVVGSNSNDNYIISGQTTNEVTITWTNIATGTYYVGVTETIGTCSTSRYTTIKVEAAAYDLVVVNEDASGNTITLESCMTGAGRIFSKEEAITPQNNVLYYTVSLENSGTLFTPAESWVFDYTLTVKDAAGNAKTATVAVVDGAAGVSGIGTGTATSATEVTVTGINKFTISVTVADNPGTSSNDDLLVVFTGSDLEVGAGKISETNVEANTITFERNTYPNTSAITIN